MFTFCLFLHSLFSSDCKSSLCSLGTCQNPSLLEDCGKYCTSDDQCDSGQSCVAGQCGTPGKIGLGCEVSTFCVVMSAFHLDSSSPFY